MRLEATGKNVELAIQNGLLECGLTREEVQVKVLEEGGMFKKAKVLLLSGEDVETEAKAEQPAEVENLTNEASENAEAKDLAETAEETATTEHIRPKRVVDTSRIQARGQEFLVWHVWWTKMPQLIAQLAKMKFRLPLRAKIWAN